MILTPGLPLAAAGKLELQIATAPLSARATISRIEREKRNVALRNIEAIATAFNPSPRALS
ncbi:MAG: helix-turn-helix transcriptional regulator, partial [Candidatus Binatus sp.]